MHAEHIRSLRILEWSAGGWRGTLYLRIGLAVAVSVTIDRAGRRATVDWQVERALAGSQTPPAAGHQQGLLALSWGSATAPEVLSAELRCGNDSALSEQVVPALERALRCARAVLVERAAQLNLRMDGAALMRCPVCLGPLSSRSGPTEGSGRCGWEGHLLATGEASAATAHESR